MSKQTAVEFLAEKFNYITWMRNRDEISAGTADEWRAKFLKEAKAMEKEQVVFSHEQGRSDKHNDFSRDGQKYYNATFGDVV